MGASPFKSSKKGEKGKIMSCYIIREHLPNGAVSDNGYYEREEMLMDLEEFKSGSNPFEVIPCTADDVRYGLGHKKVAFSSIAYEDADSVGPFPSHCTPKEKKGGHL